MKTIRYIVASSAVALLVSGCGGSSSSSSASGGTTIPTAAVQITAANAGTVAKGASSSASGMAKASSGNAAAVGVMVVSGSAHRSVHDIALSEFNRVLSLPLPKQTVVGAIPTMTMDCATMAQAAPGVTANTFSLSYTQANAAATSLAAGDVMTMTYNNCAMAGAGSTMNGSVTFTVTSLSGSRANAATTPFSAGFKMVFSNFSDRMTNGDTSSMNGDFTVTTNSNGVTVNDSMSGASFAASSTTAGVTDDILMTNYNITYTDSVPTGGAYSYSVNMTVASTGMNGSVTIATSPAFAGTGAGNPTSGAMTISGASGGSIQLTAKPDGLNVTMVVTPSGGTAGAPQTVAWTAL